ncbi:hypothetical protein QE152_g40735 [Popillia japonica]|uniref:HTH CENPB-type domain-containing protein n=1 Tax=Popillia japonica TaxID=7064 RepID=A0AAW1HFK0_POPJA
MNEKLGGSSVLKASTDWLKNFKSRHGIRKLEIQGGSDILNHVQESQNIIEYDNEDVELEEMGNGPTHEQAFIGRNGKWTNP